MPGQISYKGEITLEYIKKFPNASTMAIARMLNNDHPIDFPKVQSARTIVRNYRNELSRGPLKAIDTSELTRTETEKKQFMKRNFELPESDYEKIEPFIIPKGQNNILLLSDIHLPYQDNKALELAIQYGISQNVNAIYLNGDTLDMYQMSRFIKDRRLRDMSGELDIAREFLKMLQDTFQCPIYYKIGNHEERWENFLRLQAPELLGISDFEISSILRFR